MINAQRYANKHVQMNQKAINDSVSTHYTQAIRLKQGLDFKVNWNGVSGALNLNIES